MLYWGIKFPGKQVFGYAQYLQDQIVFYKGLFGVPSYLVWYMASDKTYTIGVGDIFEFMIFEAPQFIENTIYRYPEPNFSDDMVIINIYFDVEIGMFKIIALSYFWYLLANTKQLTAIDVGTLDKPVSGKEVIKKLVDIANRDQKRWASVETRGATDKIGYVSINQDPEVSVLDKISDICLENGWEWYIGKGDVEGTRTNVIYIGDELVIKKRYVVPFEPERGHKQLIETSLYITFTTESVWCEPMLSYEKPPTARAIWVKFFLGNEGGLMTVMMQKIGWKTIENGNEVTNSGFKIITENEFIETLDTGLAREYGLQRLFKYPLRSYPLLIGKMFGKPTTTHIEEYSAPEWVGDIETRVKNLNKQTFKKDFSKLEKAQHYLKNSKMTTPFAGDNVGVLYPQVEGHKTLLAPDGQRDEALIGPGYFGPGDRVPIRSSNKDYRLQLPNAVIFIKEDGTVIIEQFTPGNSTPSGSGTYIKFDTAGNIEIDGTATITIGGAAAVALSEALHMHDTGNLGIVVPPHNPSHSTIKLKGG